MTSATPGLLEGVRVLSFETALALPSGTRLLADLGADVVVVRREHGGFSHYVLALDGASLNKRFVSINLKHDRGLELAHRAIAVTDVVCANLRPGVLASFGLDYQRLCSKRPDLVYVQLSGYGSPGPWSAYPAYGPSVEAASGFNWLLGQEDGTPGRIGSAVFGDQIAGRFAALGALAGLQRRQETGRGSLIDLSMTESLTTFIGEEILAAQRSHYKRPLAERPLAGVYPCSGDDDWIAISPHSDVEWVGFAALMGENSADTQFATKETRRMHAQSLDSTISSWTANRDKHELAVELQRAGIAAAAVERPAEIPFHPQVQHRGLMQRVTHVEPFLGYQDHLQHRAPWLIANQSRPLHEPAGIGMDNTVVLGQWLGLTSAEVADLRECGALEPPIPWDIHVPMRATSKSSSLPVAPGSIDDGFAARLGLTKAPE
jgi:crotonobetainyl-CoA:carnitine CoA-transferase CaiB-like acyl-CoA transferase